MSGDFRDFRELIEAHCVQPGQFAAVRHDDDATIRARNAACTPVEVWHFAPEFAGVNNGETGV